MFSFDLPRLASCAALAPLALMLIVTFAARLPGARLALLWRLFHAASAAACAVALAALALRLGGIAATGLPAPLTTTTPGAVLAVLVQLLATVIGSYSARYLEGEGRQAGYVAALAAVLAAVHLLLLADHWLLFIAAWALVGIALHPLLCFYAERPFALLAAHKKRLGDRLADALLIGAALLAWQATGSGSIDVLLQHAAAGPLSPSLQASAVCLALAVILRAALLPLHGWLTQVMEAPTPVSALLHAGVVNLGGFVLIRFAALLDGAPLARALLVGAGLATAVLAGCVMLTRISIKVRLAWSTVAQMGFMVLECGLGLYQLALLHLLGHSLYKAHSFLSASSIVQHTRLRMLQGTQTIHRASLLTAPALALLLIALVETGAAKLGASSWPWWWSAILALAWAPMLWLPENKDNGAVASVAGGASGAAMVGLLAIAAASLHALPLGAVDRPHDGAGLIALAGLTLLYLGQASLQTGRSWPTWRRWSYAGFYLDERATRIALWLWPARWTAAAVPGPAAPSAAHYASPSMQG